MVLERNFLGADAGIFRQNEVLMKKIPLKEYLQRSISVLSYRDNSLCRCYAGRY